jgi:hypothetical protein
MQQSQGKPGKGKPGKQKPGKGGNPHQQAHPDMDEHDESSQDEGDEMPEGMEKYADLMQQLEAHAGDVEEQAEGMDPEMLEDPSQAMDDDAKMEVEECLEALDDSLVEEMHDALKGISHDDAQMLADHLEQEGMITDADMVAGFLFRVGQLDGAAGGDDHGDDGDDADEDMDDDDDVMGGDAA